MQNISEELEQKMKIFKDKKVVYLYDTKTRFYHDKSCKIGWGIPLSRLETYSDFPRGKKYRWCNKCYRIAMVRAAMPPEEIGKIDLYLLFFDRFSVSKRDLYDLLIKYQGKIRLIQYNTMEIAIGEDVWRFIDGYNNRVMLIHGVYKNRNGKSNFREHVGDRWSVKRYELHQMIRNILSADWRERLKPAEVPLETRSKMNPNAFMQIVNARDKSRNNKLVDPQKFLQETEKGKKSSKKRKKSSESKE